MNTTSLSAALKAVFGNNTTDNPSSSSKIPYCGSDGLPAGLASMSNLATVLGVDGKAIIDVNKDRVGLINKGDNVVCFVCAHSTDYTEASCYFAYHSIDTPNQYTYFRLDDGTSCAITFNSVGTCNISNPTSGKTYEYDIIYFRKFY